MRMKMTEMKIMEKDDEDEDDGDEDDGDENDGDEYNYIITIFNIYIYIFKPNFGAPG